MRDPVTGKSTMHGWRPALIVLAIAVLLLGGCCCLIGGGLWWEGAPIHFPEGF